VILTDDIFELELWLMRPRAKSARRGRGGKRREEGNCERGEMEDVYEQGENVELWECKKVS
jgi:hypothetical protein